MASTRFTANMIDAKITNDPVAGIIQMLGRASKLAYRYNDIDFAQHLAQSLEHSQNHIETSFNKGLAKHGNLQLESLLDDVQLTTELKGVKLSLLELVETLRDYGDEPANYDESMFLKLQQDSEAARNKTLLILQRLSQSLPELPPLPHRSRSDRTSPSIQQRSNPRAISQAPTRNLPPVPSLSKVDPIILNYGGLPLSPPPSEGFRSPTLENEMDFGSQDGNSIRDSRDYDYSKYARSSRAESLASSSGVGTPYESRRNRNSDSNSNSPAPNSRENGIPAKPSNSFMLPPAALDSPEIESQSQNPNTSRLISSPDLASSMSPKSLPERPRETRARMSSLGRSIPEEGTEQQNGNGYPFPPRIDSQVTGPTSSSAPLTTGVTSYFGDTSTAKRQSTASDPRSPSSPSVGRKNSHRQSIQSIQSDKSASDPPELEKNRESRTALASTPEISYIDNQESLQNLSTTLAVPGYGKGVPDGLEVSKHVARDSSGRTVPDGLLLADEVTDNSSTSQTSIPTPDYPIEKNASFYQMGGWCEGALILQKGMRGSVRIVSTPTGNYTSTKSARCAKCSFEVPFSIIEMDLMNDKAGVFTHQQIRWRTRFLQMCHMQTKSIDQGIYACPFCVEAGKTVDIDDATIFHSPAQILKHLEKHTNRPRQPISWVHVVSGPEAATAIDLDIAFLDDASQPIPPAHSATTMAKLNSLPSAITIAPHHPQAAKYMPRDPEGYGTLRFAKGAWIGGIEWPARWEGRWCVGWHDGKCAAFPSTYVRMHEPVNFGITTENRSSGLSAVARWEHKVEKEKDSKGKEAKEKGARWLSFPKGAKISNVSFNAEGDWCWGGEYKGKYGLFPACYVLLVDGRLESLIVQKKEQDPETGSVKTTTGKSIFRGFSKRSAGSSGS